MSSSPERPVIVLGPKVEVIPPFGLAFRLNAKDSIGIERAPLLHAALLFALGILAAHWLWFRPAWLTLGIFALVPITILALFVSRRTTNTSLAVLLFLTGVWSAELEPQPSPSPSIATMSDGLLRNVEASVVDAGPLRPELAHDENDQPISILTQRVDLELSSIENITDTSDAQQPASGRVRVEFHWPAAEQPKELTCGQRLRVNLQLFLPLDYHDPSVWSRTQSLLEQGITATARQDATTIERLNTTSSQQLIPCKLALYQREVGARLQSLPPRMTGLPAFLRLSTDDTAMLAAMVAGDRTYLTHSLRIGFERTGSFHLLVVSGFHLAVLSGLILWIGKKLRVPDLYLNLIAIFLSIAYAAFTGFALPIRRALLMVLLYLVGRLFNRDKAPLNLIGFTALIMLAASPRALFDASLQMTLLSVIAIAAIARPLLWQSITPYRLATRDLMNVSLDTQLPIEAISFRLWLRRTVKYSQQWTGIIRYLRYLPRTLEISYRFAEIILIAFIVEVSLTLPMAIYFHRFTLFAIPTNILLMPMLVLLIPAAMLTLLASAFIPSLAVIPATITAAILHVDLAFVSLFSRLRMADLRVAMPHQWQIACFYLGLAITIYFAIGTWQRRAIAWGTLLLTALIPILPLPATRPLNAALFEAFDVGQGDSLLLISPDGKTLLIDGGGSGSYQNVNTANFDIGEEVVSVALWERGIRRLDAVALTHAHSDHMGGLPSVLRNFKPHELWVGKNPPIAEYNLLLDEARTLGIEVRHFQAGQNLDFGSMNIQVLAPFATYQPGIAPTNNDSLVLRASYRQSSLLLEGDAEAPIEHAMLSEPNLKSSLLKIGHHGSLTSTTPDFLARVQPEWAVISCGLRNRYGHPREEVLKELTATHVRIFTTDTEGALCFKLDGKTIEPIEDCAHSNGKF